MVGAVILQLQDSNKTSKKEPIICFRLHDCLSLPQPRAHGPFLSAAEHGTGFLPPAWYDPSKEE